MRAIVLVGYRGCGKTTIGTALATALGWPFVDADRILERRAGRPIGRIFADDGEGAFRDREEAVLGDLLATPAPWVLATGGGAVLREANRKALVASPAAVVYLHAAPAVLAARLAADAGDRPSLTGKPVDQEVEEVLAVRDPLYRAVASRVVEVDRPLAEIVADLRT